jgi:hypothetical protein
VILLAKALPQELSHEARERLRGKLSACENVEFKLVSAAARKASIPLSSKAKFAGGPGRPFAIDVTIVFSAGQMITGVAS